MKRFVGIPLLCLPLLLTADPAAADGPFSHHSNGSTQPIIQQDSNGNIVNVQCVAGSRCMTRASVTPPGAGATQTLSFWLQTGASVTTDHFAFGVRGNPNNEACDSGSILLSNPFWGRGLIIYSGGPTKLAKFENFTLNCVRASAAGLHRSETGVVESSGQVIAFQPNTQYMITVWANDVNTGYDIEKRYYNAQDQAWDFIPIAFGDCLSEASAADDYKCAKRPEDPATANRTFVGSVTDLVWSVTNWYIY